VHCDKNLVQGATCTQEPLICKTVAFHTIAVAGCIVRWMMVACKYKTLLIITDTTVTANGLNFVNFQNKIRVTGRANRTSKTRIAMLKLLAWGLAGFSALLAISQTVQSIINKSRSVTSLILLSKQTVGGECDAPAYCPRYRHRIYWHSDNELTDYEDNVLKAISRRAAHYIPRFRS
jgi:hypothetical protein